MGIPNAGPLVHRLIHSFRRVSLANARDLGEWMGAPSHTNFKLSLRYSSSVAPRRLRTDIVTSARPFDMDIHLQSFTILQLPSLMIAVSMPVYFAVLEHSSS